MCSARGFVFFVLSASLLFNCMQFPRVVVGTSSSSNSSGSNNNNNNENTNNIGGAGGGEEDKDGGNVGAGLRIDITRKRTVQLNGIEIDENSLLEHLEEHERELIFGKDTKKPDVKLVHLRQRTDGPLTTTTISSPHVTDHDLLQQQKQKEGQHQRIKRSAADSGANGVHPTPKVSIQMNDDATGLPVNLDLRPTPKLIDDAFVFIRRYANSTQFIEDSHRLAQRYASCFYSNENSALDLCDEENVRGILHHNSTDFIIHPLPERFGSAAHVIVAASRERPSYHALVSPPPTEPVPSLSDEDEFQFQFEPDEDEFEEMPGEAAGSAMTSSLPNHNNTKIHHSPTTERMTSDAAAARSVDNMNDDLSPQQQHHPLPKSQHRSNLKEHPQQHNHHQQELNHHSQQLNHHPHEFNHNHLHKNNHHPHKRNHHPHEHNHHPQELKRHPQELNHHPQELNHHPQELNHHPQELNYPRHDEQQQQEHTHHPHHQQHHHRRRRRRHISTSGSQWKVPQVLHIETAIFVDSDLFKHMAKNFPKNTESHLIRFVLAMINGVQLLYHHPSLGHRVNFVLKRLEILYKDPKDLRRSSDIDTYLSNFCMWQKSLNPPSDTEAVHYDHAVILTGLDLYVVGKNGKVISQVVGLAPVAGMCTSTSSCTINEGKHFESVFVVAHEIGHNLGMRHDTKENSCDPSLYIMSPTLGSGKITWSKCSRTYLNTFLETNQAKCLFDRGQFVNNLDHAAEGMLPGERFDANQQCMLKYGRDTVRARSQIISDICRDLHCQRDRYTWTSHPALEGTECGDSMWCRSGVCVMRPSLAEAYAAPKQLAASPGKMGYDKASFLESSKMGHLLHEYNYNKAPAWGDWGEASECDSGCLYGPSKRLREGSTGLRTYSRSCLDYRRRCQGRDRKFESCIAKQCYSIAITTIEDFATQVCVRAQKFDAELTGEGAQIVGDIEESCKIFCRTKVNGTKSRSWTFPDGTTCRSKEYNFDDTAYCIAGRCERFSCDNFTNNYYKIDPIFCQQRRQAEAVVTRAPPTSPPPSEENQDLRRAATAPAPHPGPRLQTTFSRYADRDATYSSNTNREVLVGPPTTPRSKYENEVALRNYHGQSPEQSQYKRKSDNAYPDTWSNKYNNNNNNYHLGDQRPTAIPVPLAAPPASVGPPVSASLVASGDSTPEWTVKSGCHSSCMAKSKGIQVVTSRRTGANNIQLCTHTVKPCERLQTPTEYAEQTCARYKQKVRGLSGHGTQIAASVDEPDRSCRVGCQDEFIKYRFYLVNGRYGHFPLGTKCSHTEERYCVNGKCLEFGPDNIPLQQSHISLALFRSRRSLTPADDHNDDDDDGEEDSLVVGRQRRSSRRRKRSFLYYTPVNITETITQDFIDKIVHSIVGQDQHHQQPHSHQHHHHHRISHVLGDESASLDTDHIEFHNPILVMSDELRPK